MNTSDESGDRHDQELDPNSVQPVDVDEVVRRLIEEDRDRPLRHLNGLVGPED